MKEMVYSSIQSENLRLNNRSPSVLNSSLGEILPNKINRYLVNKKNRNVNKIFEDSKYIFIIF